MAEKPDSGSVCCIGAMTMDRTLSLQMPGNLGTSNPVFTRQCRGGVARNVAENLARLGVQAKLVAMVGDDEDGRAIVLATSQEDVDTGLVQKSLSHATGTYTAVLQPDGELFAGFADMEICESMGRGFIQNRWIQISNSALAFADTNLPADSLAYLIAGCREENLTLVVDAVSTANARKLPLNLHGVDTLFCNIEEARVILGDDNAKDPDTVAKALCQRGVASTVVTAGRDGLCFASADRCAALPAEATGPLDVSDAGDALIAGMLYGRLLNYDPVVSLRIGIKAAGITNGSADSNCPDLTVASITAGLGLEKSGR